MAMLRDFGARWLRAVVRRAPPGSKPWASAMLRELDFIESDWAAVLWALGSTAAICRHSAREWRTRILRRGREEERTMKETAMKVVGVLAGVFIALGVLGVGAFGVHGVVFRIFPALAHGSLPWPVWIASLVVEALLVVGAVKLWQKRRPMAVGILLTAVMFATHFAIHVASHWNG